MFDLHDNSDTDSVNEEESASAVAPAGNAVTPPANVVAPADKAIPPAAKAVPPAAKAVAAKAVAPAAKAVTPPANVIAPADKAVAPAANAVAPAANVTKHMPHPDTTCFYKSNMWQCYGFSQNRCQIQGCVCGKYYCDDHTFAHPEWEY